VTRLHCAGDVAKAMAPDRDSFHAGRHARWSAEGDGQLRYEEAGRREGGGWHDILRMCRRTAMKKHSGGSGPVSSRRGQNGRGRHNRVPVDERCEIMGGSDR